MQNSYPWRRYFDRHFDYLFFGIFIFVVLAFLFPGLFADKQSEQALGLLLLIIYIPLDALQLMFAKRSLGKALYGVYLRPPQEFTGSIALKRAVFVWWRGMGIGFPLVSLFTLLKAHKRLKQTGTTSWDQDLHISVAYGQLGALRWIGIIIAWIAVLTPVLIGMASLG